MPVSPSKSSFPTEMPGLFKRMRREQTLLLLFIPLLLLLGFLLFILPDLKHPAVTQDTCSVLGTGPAMAKYRTSTNMVYTQGASAIHDVALRCDHLGILMMNEPEPFSRSISPGDPAHIQHRVYKFGLDQWRAQVGR